MKKHIITFIIIVAISIISCSKTEDTNQVEYMVTGLTEPYSIVLIDDTGNSLSETVSPQSNEWEYSKYYDMNRGDIVYLYLKTGENTDNSPTFSAGIIINGKYSYQRKGYDSNTGDSIYELKVSGIVPL